MARYKCSFNTTEGFTTLNHKINYVTFLNPLKPKRGVSDLGFVRLGQKIPHRHRHIQSSKTEEGLTQRCHENHRDHRFHARCEGREHT
jgi:hypothetical protein